MHDRDARLPYADGHPTDVTEVPMDEEALNMSVRKFLKKLGVTSQREIETGVRALVDAGELTGNERLEVRATIVVDGLPQDIVVEGTITLA